MVKEGAVVIDVGINRIQESGSGRIRLVGDVDFEGEHRQSRYKGIKILTGVKFRHTLAVQLLCRNEPAFI